MIRLCGLAKLSVRFRKLYYISIPTCLLYCHRAAGRFRVFAACEGLVQGLANTKHLTRLALAQSRTVCKSAERSVKPPDGFLESTIARRFARSRPGRPFGPGNGRRAQTELANSVDMPSRVRQATVSQAGAWRVCVC